MGLEAARKTEVVINQGFKRALQGKAELFWQVEVVASNVIQVMEGFRSVGFNWLRRDLNSTANGVARWMMAS